MRAVVLPALWSDTARLKAPGRSVRQTSQTMAFCFFSSPCFLEEQRSQDQAVPLVARNAP